MVGNDGVNAAVDHIAHVFLVVYRPGVDLHAAAVVQIDQLRLILEQHIARVHVVRVGALNVLVDVEIRLVVEQAGLDVRAELLELLHGNMVEGGDEYAVLHLVCGDGVDDALLQTLVEYLVVLQLHIEQHIGLVAEIEQLVKRPDVLSCEFGGLPGADVQLEHLLVGVVLDEAGAVRGALYRCIMENNELAVLRDMNVALKAVCTGLLDRLVECERAVLRVFARETAVREQHDLFHIRSPLS